MQGFAGAECKAYLPSAEGRGLEDDEPTDQVWMVYYLLALEASRGVIVALRDATVAQCFAIDDLRHVAVALGYVTPGLW